MFKKVLILILTVTPLFGLTAAQSFGFEKSVAMGATIDVAPFGIEKKYLTVQTSLASTGIIGLALQPSFSAGRSSYMVRVPLCVRIIPFSINQLSVSAYGGCGVEKYESEYQNCTSSFLTGGIIVRAGQFYVDFNVSDALRPEQDDKDAGVLLGYVF